MRCPSCRLENPPSSKRCDCGHIFGQPVSTPVRRASTELETGKVVVRLVCALASLGSIAGGTELLLGWSSATAAPQQAVITLTAIAWAVLPYCLARAVSGVIRGS